MLLEAAEWARYLLADMRRVINPPARFLLRLPSTAGPTDVAQALAVLDLACSMTGLTTLVIDIAGVRDGWTLVRRLWKPEYGEIPAGRWVGVLAAILAVDASDLVVVCGLEGWQSPPSAVDAAGMDFDVLNAVLCESAPMLLYITVDGDGWQQRRDHPLLRIGTTLADPEQGGVLHDVPPPRVRPQPSYHEPHDDASSWDW